MAHYGIWYDLKLETLTPKQEYLLGIKLSEFPIMALYYLSKRRTKIGIDNPWSIPPIVVLPGLVAYALLGCVALMSSLCHIRQLES